MFSILLSVLSVELKEKTLLNVRPVSKAGSQTVAPHVILKKQPSKDPTAGVDEDEG